MGFSTGYTVLIILPAFLLHTSGLYIASSVGEWSPLERGQCLRCSSYLIISYQLGCAGALARSLEVWKLIVAGRHCPASCLCFIFATLLQFCCK